MKRLSALALAALLLAGGSVLRGQEPAAESPAEQAVQMLAEGKIDEAIALLEPLVAGAPAGQLETIALLGVLYLESGRPDDALATLKPLADLEQADPGVLYNAARAAFALGENRLAEDYLVRSADLAPLSPAARELGLLRGRQRRFQEAYARLVPWARRNPDDVEARLAGAMSALQLERAPAAEELLSDLPQDSPQVKLLWGRLLLLKGDPWGAVATLKPILADPPAKLERDVRWSLAEAYIMAGNSASAVELLQGRTESFPEGALRLSQAQYLSGDLDAALATVEPLAEKLLAAGGDDRPPPPGPRLLLQYGRLLGATGSMVEALPALEAASRWLPEERQVWQALGQSLAAAGRTEEAEAALARFKELVAAQPPESAEEIEAGLQDPTGRELRRGLELLASDPQSALAIARQERELAPGDPRPGLLEARALLELERPEEALDTVGRVLALAPESADANYLRGVVRMVVSDLEGAEADLRRALELSAEHTAAMSDLAVLLMEKGEDEEARALLERVLELRPGDPVAAANLERLGG